MSKILLIGAAGWSAMFAASVLAFYGIRNIVLCYKERNALRIEVKQMHRRSNRVSAEYLSARGDLEEQLSELEQRCNRIRQEAVADGWVNRAVLDDYERIIDQQAQDMARQKHIIDTLNKQLERRAKRA